MSSIFIVINCYIKIKQSTKKEQIISTRTALTSMERTFYSEVEIIKKNNEPKRGILGMM